MKKSEVEFFRSWFSDYVKKFYSPLREDQNNIRLKEEHTFSVCSNMAAIAEGLCSDESGRAVAEVIALFHDIGRFRQYAEFKTFRDSLSVNHGELGARILGEEGVLREFPDEVRELITHSVKFHNALSIPYLHDDRKVLYLKMIRDADKLDIWRVFIDYYESPEEGKASAAGLGLPDEPVYSRDILSCLYEKRTALLSQMKTLHDFKLLQLSWVYDLNFSVSFSMLRQRGYVQRIASHLPQTEEVSNGVAIVEAFVDLRISENYRKDTINSE